MWANGRIRTRKGAKLRKREAFSSAARKERSDAAGRGRRSGGRGPLRPISAESSPPSRHLGTVPKCRLGTIFEDPPKAPVQKMANMSTVTVIVTFSLSTKDLLMGLILIKDFFY